MTKLYVGATSRNVVHAAASIAAQRPGKVGVIASRTQVDAGGGYLGWGTGQFVRAVRGYAKDIEVGRDHGGPLVEPYQEDLYAGCTFIHIDPSVTYGGAPVDDPLTRALQIYERISRSGITFEIGAEEQTQAPTGDTNDRLDDLLETLWNGRAWMPKYVVAQVGTRTVERANDGVLAVCSTDAARARISPIARVCHNYQTGVKVHNADYLRPSRLRLLAQCGVDGVNIAPEYGVAETMAWIMLLEDHGLFALRDDLLAHSYEHGGWKKWVPAGDAAIVGDKECAIIGGHYTFNTHKARDIKSRTARHLGMNIDHWLMRALSHKIERHLWAIG